MMPMLHFLMQITLNLSKSIISYGGRKMSGIKVSVKTKAKETLKLSNHLRSYLFEQEYDELSNCTPTQKKTLREALLVLDSVISKSK